MHPLARALREGEDVEDDALDALLSVRSQLSSRAFWSPVTAARRAAELLRGAGAKEQEFQTGKPGAGA